MQFTSLFHKGNSWECSARHFHKCQWFTAIVKHLHRHKMSASLFSHNLCELLTSENVNEQTTMGEDRFLEGRKTLQYRVWSPHIEKCVSYTSMHKVKVRAKYIEHHPTDIILSSPARNWWFEVPSIKKEIFKLC